MNSEPTTLLQGTLDLLRVFSVISYTVAMQSHEIGIRMALGAQATQILSLVVNKGMRLILSES